MLCGKPVSHDEIGLTKKLINRGTTDYLCLSCLASRLRVKEKDLLELAESFRKAGCSLFR